MVIATEWKEFNSLNWEAIYERMNKPAFVFDGRLLVDADKLGKIGFKVRDLVYIMASHRMNRLGVGDDDWTR